MAVGSARYGSGASAPRPTRAASSAYYNRSATPSGLRPTPPSAPPPRRAAANAPWRVSDEPRVNGSSGVGSRRARSRSRSPPRRPPARPTPGRGGAPSTAKAASARAQQPLSRVAQRLEKVIAGEEGFAEELEDEVGEEGGDVENEPQYPADDEDLDAQLAADEEVVEVEDQLEDGVDENHVEVEDENAEFADQDAEQEVDEDYPDDEEPALEDAVASDEEVVVEEEEEPAAPEEKLDVSELAGPKREDDLDLEDVPEHMKDAVEGSIKLGRLLSRDATKSPGPSSAKNLRPTGTAAGVHQLDPWRSQLLAHWGLLHDPAMRYVVANVKQEDLEDLLRSGWRPRPPIPPPPGARRGPKTCAEQTNERLLQNRDRKGPDRGVVDALEAFKHVKKLKDRDVDILKKLSHKDLRYVLQAYDGTKSLKDLVDEAALEEATEAPMKTDEAAPDKPGIFTLGRRLRLELIDPEADAMVCGDANLSFSLILTEHRKALNHTGRTLATTFETLEILRERYPEIKSTIQAIEANQAEVMHNVDATRLSLNPGFLGMEGRFGAVYYNFPHAGVIRGFFDGHPFVRWRHENLMTLFFRQLRDYVMPGGIVKVASNSHATGVRYSDILLGASDSEFVHVETVPFLEWQLRNYKRSYGDRRDKNRRPEEGEGYRDQKATTDMVYCFRYEPSGATPPKPRVRFPPEKQHLLDAEEGDLRGLSAHTKKRRVEEMYELFLSYVNGIHIG